MTQLQPQKKLMKMADHSVIKTMEELLTEYQIGKIFNIGSITLKKLIRNGKIPFTMQGSRVRFDIDTISQWITANPLIENEEEIYLCKIRAEWQEKSPGIFEALRAIDQKAIVNSNAQKSPKRYNLIKRPSKRYGYLYYVRYIDGGKLIPSKWNTHTNILTDAKQFAQENRERILSEYRSKHNQQGELFTILGEYYKAGSSYLEKDKNRNRILCEKTRSVYYHFMTKKLIPYLQAKAIKTFREIDPPVIAKFQDYLLSCGNKPQTVNRYLSSINIVFNHLLINGKITENAFDRVKALKIGDKSTDIRGCHDIDNMKGVFNTQWNDALSYLLCLIIYSTGMRNSEIEKIRVEDIVEIEGIHFIDIKKSKSLNGVRLIPLHDFVYKKIQRYIKKSDRKNGDYIFSSRGGHNQSTVYNRANLIMGERLGLSAEELNDQMITFYSGRHFWKTLMNSEDLGEDIEEFFMGHKVSGDVSKTYNHKDKRGRGKLIEKAKEVFVILDKKLFS
jgi:excisionase family DNA binding protein